MDDYYPDWQGSLVEGFLGDGERKPVTAIGTEALAIMTDARERLELST